MLLCMLEPLKYKEEAHEKKIFSFIFFFTFFYLLHLNTKGNHLSLINTNAKSFILVSKILFEKVLASYMDFYWFEVIVFFNLIYLNSQIQVNKSVIQMFTLPCLYPRVNRGLFNA